MTDPFGLAGQVLDGQFRVDHYIGEGGFGVVYRGQNIGLDEPIAIKCLKLGGALYGQLAENFVQRFRDESKLLYKLSQGNLNIVRSIAAGSVIAPVSGATIPYMVLEWLEGRSLQQDFEQRRGEKKEGRPLDEVLDLFAGAADGLSYAHKQGVVHRDLNPGNVFLIESAGPPTTKVLDFGVAKLARDHSLAVDLRAQTLGNIRIFAPAYGSPEQFDDKVGEIGPWSDVYSFALIVLEALRDRTVVEGEHLGEYARFALEGPRPTPRSIGVACGDEIEACFSRALSLSPRDRWQTMGDFWVVLKNAAKIESARRQGRPLGPKETAPVMSMGTKTRAEFAETARAEVPEGIANAAPVKVPAKGATLAMPMMSPFAGGVPPQPQSAHPGPPPRHTPPPQMQTVAMGPSAAGFVRPPSLQPGPMHGSQQPPATAPPQTTPPQAQGPRPGYAPQPGYGGAPPRTSTPFPQQPGQPPQAAHQQQAAQPPSSQHASDPGERLSVAGVPSGSSSKLPLFIGLGVLVFLLLGGGIVGIIALRGRSATPPEGAPVASVPPGASVVPAATASAALAPAEPPASAPEPSSSAPAAASAAAPESTAAASGSAAPKPSSSAAPKPSASVDPRAWSEENAKKALVRQSGAFIACKDKENPIDKGTAMVTFAPDGTVSNVDVAPPLKGTKTGNCVVSQLKRAQMSAFDGGSQTVAYSVTIP